MNEEQLREPPAARFAVTNLHFDLHEEIAALRAEPRAAAHGHRQKALFKHGGRTIALFVLEAGSGLPAHAARGTVSVQALEGEIEMKVDGESGVKLLRPGSVLIMTPGLRHDVHARTEAAFLLQVSLEPPPA